MRYKLLALVGLVWLATTLPGFAQESGEVISTGDSTLHLTAPAGWLAIEGSNLIIMADSQATMALDDLNTLQNGQWIVGVLTTTFMSDQMAIPLDAEIDAIAQGFTTQSTLEIALPFAEPETGVLDDGSQWIGAVVTSEQVGSAYFVVEKPDGLRFLIFGGAHLDQFEMLTAEMRAIAESVQSGRAPATNPAALVWVAEGEVEALSGTPVIIEDTVYVGAGLQGIASYTLDGELIGVSEVRHDNRALAVYDLAASPDGQLWITQLNQIHQVSPAGEILFSFGKDDAPVGSTASNLTTDASGNVYVTVNRDNLTYLQVWTVEGGLTHEFQISDPESHVWGMSARPEGELHVLVLGDEAWIKVYDAAGNLLREVDNTQFALNVVEGMTVLADGTLILGVTSIESSRGYTLLHLAADGSLLAKFQGADLGLDKILSPRGFTLTPDGDLIMVDANFESSRLVRIGLQQAATLE